MNYYDQQRMKRLKSIDRSLKEISYFLHVFVEAVLDGEPEVPEPEEKAPVVSNAVGFEVSHDDGE